MSRKPLSFSGTGTAVQKLAVKGERVYIFEGHNLALLAWVEIKANQQSELILIALDYHTDTKLAFKKFANQASNGDRSKIEALIADKISKIDLGSKQSILRAVMDLENDEQIDAAMRLSLFSCAFCFNQKNRNTQSIDEEKDFDNGWDLSLEEGLSKLVPSNRIFTVGEPYAVGWSGSLQHDDWDKPFADQAIESVMLAKLLNRANGMAGRIGIEDISTTPFVLDIDLDYFRTLNSLSPKDPTVFHELINSAKAITIATEPSYVRRLRLEEELTADYALEEVLEHINAALSA